MKASAVMAKQAAIVAKNRARSQVGITVVRTRQPWVGSEAGARERR